MNEHPPQTKDTNPDPITGEPGAHPLGTGVGAAGGAVTGAAVGAVGGPVGSVLGAIVGGVMGGLAGKGVAEAIDPTAEDAHWRANHGSQDFADKSFNYDDDYAPAYRHGYNSFGEHKTTYTEAEKDLAVGWEKVKGKSRLTWEKAKNATKAGWQRVENAVSGR